MLPAGRNMSGESEAAWRALLDDLVARGLKMPEFLVVDSAAGLEKALAALWPEVPTERCCPQALQRRLCHREGGISISALNPRQRTVEPVLEIDFCPLSHSA